MIRYNAITSLKISSNVIEKYKQRKVIFLLEENRQAQKYLEKYEALKYPLSTFPLAISATEGKLYQPKTKYHFRNYFVELSNGKVS